MYCTSSSKQKGDHQLKRFYTENQRLKPQQIPELKCLIEGKRQSNGKSKLLEFTFLSFPRHICRCISILASPHNPKLEPDFIQQTINGNKRSSAWWLSSESLHLVVQPNSYKLNLT